MPERRGPLGEGGRQAVPPGEARQGDTRPQHGQRVRRIVPVDRDLRARLAVAVRLQEVELDQQAGVGPAQGVDAGFGQGGRAARPERHDPGPILRDLAQVGDLALGVLVIPGGGVRAAVMLPPPAGRSGTREASRNATRAVRWSSGSMLSSRARPASRRWISARSRMVRRDPV